MPIPPDVVFETYQFAASGTGTVNRTMADRLADVFNVKDFGAVGSGFVDDQPAIQRAVDAASLGGTVFFPPGNYRLDSRIYILGTTNANIKFIGSGGHDSPSAGTHLSMSIRDYILYASLGNNVGFTISLIEGIAFHNTATGAAPTTSLPPNLPEISVNVTGSQAGVSGVVRLLCNTFVSMAGGTEGVTFITGNSVVVAGVGGTPNVNGTRTVNAPNYDMVSFIASTTGSVGGTSGNVRLLSNGFNADWGKGIKVGDVITVAGVNNMVGGASNEANGNKTVTAVSIGVYIEISQSFIGAGGGGTIRGNWLDLVGTTFATGASSGGTVRYNGDSCGCIYISSGIGIEIRNCFFSTNIGNCIFNGAFSSAIHNCNFNGGWDFISDPSACIAINGGNHNIVSGKIGGFGVGVACYLGAQRVEMYDIERCGIGVWLGWAPLPYYDNNRHTIAPSGQTQMGPPGAWLNMLTMEACSVAFIRCSNFFGEVRNVYMHSSGQVFVPDYGLDARGATAATFYLIKSAGAFNVASIDVSTSNNCTFEFCNGDFSGGASVGWKMPTGVASGLLRFLSCSSNSAPFDGALPVSRLPVSGGFYGPRDEMLCSDSQDPAWTGTVSKVGQPINGTGSIKVLARYNPVANVWVIAG